MIELSYSSYAVGEAREIIGGEGSISVDALSPLVRVRADMSQEKRCSTRANRFVAAAPLTIDADVNVNDGMVRLINFDDLVGEDMCLHDLQFLASQHDVFNTIRQTLGTLTSLGEGSGKVSNVADISHRRP